MAAYSVDALVKGHEGLRLTPYRDTRGFDTVGWGHRCKNAVKITRAMAQRLFLADMDTAAQTAAAWLALPPAVCNLTEARYAVIVDMAFNLGPRGLMAFHKFRRALVRRDWEEASREMLSSRWAEQTGHRALHDAEIMRRGEWV